MQRVPPKIVLVGVSRQVQGLQWESDKQLRIGRHQGQDIVLNDSSVSREHAEVLATGRGWMVRDNASATGTFLNGIRLDGQPRKLQPEDVIHCSQIAFRVAVLEEGIQSPPPLPNPEKLNIKTTGFLARIQASTQRTWEQGLKGLSPDNEHMAQGKHFFTLVRAGYHLSRIGSIKELLQSILDDSVTVFNAQQGAIFLFDEAQRGLSAKALSSLRGEGPSNTVFSQTLAGRCFEKGESILCSDVHNFQELPVPVGGPMNFIICALLRSPRKKLGVLYLSRGAGDGEFTKEDLDLADALAASISTGIECAQLVEKHREPFLVKASAFVRRAMELRDPRVGRHLDRVQMYCAWLAEELGLPAAERQTLHVAACMHDLGKLVAPDATLENEYPLNEGELADLRDQLIKGEALAEALPDMEPVLPIIRGHHEHWDGTGYPEGLAGENIPLLARILAVANALDTMISERPYRSAKTFDDAISELSNKAGKQFDPKVVQVFLRLRAKVKVQVERDAAATPALASASS